MTNTKEPLFSGENKSNKENKRYIRITPYACTYLQSKIIYMKLKRRKKRRKENSRRI